MNRQVTFAADTRNLGGRKILVDLVSKHQVTIQQMKSQVSPLAFEPPKVHPAALAMKKQSVQAVIQRLVREEENKANLTKRVAAVKIQVDATKPVSFHLIRPVSSQVLGGASQKLHQFTMEEHAKNLRSQQRNIQSLSSITTRKKNFYDYTVYPVKFLPPKNAERQQDLDNSIMNAVQKQLDKSKSIRPSTAATTSTAFNSQKDTIAQSSAEYFFNIPQRPATAHSTNSTIKKQNPNSKKHKASQQHEQYQQNLQQQQYDQQLYQEANQLKVSQQNDVYEDPFSAAGSASPIVVIGDRSNSQSHTINTQQGSSLMIPNNNNNNNIGAGGNAGSMGSVNSKQVIDGSVTSLSDRQRNDEDRWNLIVEEIPYVNDMNPETIEALKIHLVNLIAENRVYRIEEFQLMKQIFADKNPTLLNDFVETIFGEIIGALDQE